jgi:isopentenyl-diphosphate Delta-isomerase
MESLFIEISNSCMVISLYTKREKGKYHSGGLWSNTCCGRPLASEISNIKEHAEIRLKEEMGFTCKLYFFDKIEYKVKCGPLLENEDDHIFVGFFEGLPHINKLEVENYRWVDSQFLVVKLNNCGNEFSEWFKIIIKSNILKEYLK